MTEKTILKAIRLLVDQTKLDEKYTLGLLFVLPLNNAASPLINEAIQFSDLLSQAFYGLIQSKDDCLCLIHI